MFPLYRGLVGPTRLFGPGAPYNVFLYALLAGALAPIPLWYYQRRFPDTRLKYVNLPVLLNGPSAAPPATGVNYASFFIIGFVFRECFRFFLWLISRVAVCLSSWTVSS
jgi:hypothetical protein